MGYKSTYELTRETAEKIMVSKIRDLSREDLSQVYRDLRLELNLSTPDNISSSEIRDFIVDNIKSATDDDLCDWLEFFEESYFRNYMIVDELDSERWSIFIEDEHSF